MVNGGKNNDRTVFVRLRLGGQELARLGMSCGCAEVAIGRSRECLLKVPSAMQSVSSRHARLFWKGRSLFLEDAGSRNGIFCKGRRVKGAVKVAQDDVFSLGDCALEFEFPEKKKNVVSGVKCHRLERINGDAKGSCIEISPKEGERFFSIGLDSSCDFVLPDMLVSRKHAVLELKENGSCWIRDNESKNGTLVNGVPLQGKERLLKDGDRISIAYFDFRFLDRNVPHTRFFFWVKLMSVVFSLGALSVAYLLWATARATVEDYLRLSRRYAESASFGEARNALNAARMARDAEKFIPQIEMLDVQIDRWEKTHGDWESARVALANGRYSAARVLLDRINSDVMDAWAWNGTTALDSKRDAELAATALRLYYDADEALAASTDNQPEQQAERIRGRLENLSKFMKSGADGFAANAYMGRMTNSLARVEREMKRALEGFSRVDACINSLDGINPDFNRLVSELEKVRRDETANRAVRDYARKYIVPCRELAVAKTFITAEFSSIVAMEFESVIGKKDSLVLPHKMLCSRHPRLSDHREKLDGHHREAQRCASALSSMVDGLNQEVFSRQSEGNGALTSVLAVKTWDEMLSFDCLGKAPPSTRRKEPAGQYDALVGIEYAYESLRSLPDPYNGRCLRILGFEPKIRVARSSLERISAFVEYMQSQKAWMRKGSLGDFLKSCKKILATRDAVVARLNGVGGSRRARLLLRFCAHYISASDDFQVRTAIAREFKEYQKRMQELEYRYECESDPEAQIKLRELIIAEGVPGDPVLHTKWVQKFEGEVK